MEVTGANQNFLIYKPREHRADAPRELTPALWQGQMQKLVRVLSTAPAPSHAPAVARVEGRVTINRLLDRMDDIRIDAEPHGPADARHYSYEPTFLLRGLTELNIEFTRAD